MLIIRINIFETGNYVVLDSGFCVAKGITELEAKGVHAEALMKEQCYWQKLIPGDLIDTHCQDKEVGDVVTIEARTQDNKLFQIFCMKDPDMR